MANSIIMAPPILLSNWDDLRSGEVAEFSLNYEPQAFWIGMVFRNSGCDIRVIRLIDGRIYGWAELSSYKNRLHLGEFSIRIAKDR